MLRAVAQHTGGTAVNPSAVEPGRSSEEADREVSLVRGTISGTVPAFSGTVDLLSSGNAWVRHDAAPDGQWRKLLEARNRRAAGAEGSTSFLDDIRDLVAKTEAFLNEMTDKLAERRRLARLGYAERVQAALEWEGSLPEAPIRRQSVAAPSPIQALSEMVAALTAPGDGSVPSAAPSSILRLDGFLAPINVDQGTTSAGSLTLYGNSSALSAAGDASTSAPTAGWYGLPPDSTSGSGAGTTSTGGSLLTLAPAIPVLPPISNPTPAAAVVTSSGSGGAITQSASATQPLVRRHTMSSSTTAASASPASSGTASPAPDVAPVAAFTITITLSEDGTGSFQNSAGFNSSLSSSMAADPGPGGLASALTFSLLSPPGLIAGDLILLDPSTATSDIIRFNTTGGTAVFYSLAGEGLLADTGFPTALYANNITQAEATSGPTFYTPTTGQPGFVSGAGGPVTYVLIPEPGTWTMMGFAFILLVSLSRTRRGHKAGAACAVFTN